MNGDDIYNLQSVEDFKIKQQFNTLENTFNDVYSSRLITHDLFTKTFKEYDFDYNVEYIKQNHLEQDAMVVIRETTMVYILPYFNYDKGDTFGTKNEGVLHFQSSTSKVHNDYEQPDNRRNTTKTYKSTSRRKQSSHRDYGQLNNRN